MCPLYGTGGHTGAVIYHKDTLCPVGAGQLIATAIILEKTFFFYGHKSLRPQSALELLPCTP